MTDKNYLVLVAREGGNVARCHTIPHHGEYSVGKHSYDALSLLMLLNPNPSINLIKYVLWHDCAERYVGDAPSPAKWYSEKFREVYEEAEEIARAKTGLTLPDLTEEEQRWATAVDRVELMLWAEDQMAFGNQHASELQYNARSWFDANVEKLPTEMVEFVNTFKWYRTHAPR